MENTNEPKQEKNGLFIAGGIVLAAIIIAVAIIYSLGNGGNNNLNNNNGQSLGTASIDLSGASFLGREDAPYTMVEFGDFQCVACAQFFDVVDPEIKSRFIDTGKAKLAFKTLTFIDSYAQTDKGESYRAGLAGECAAEQGKFWSLYDAVYSAEADEVQNNPKGNENNGNLIRSFFENWAKLNSLDTDKFLSCLDSEKYASNLSRYMEDAQKAMGSEISTPTVFIIKDGKGTKLDNPFDIDEYSAIIK